MKKLILGFFIIFLSVAAFAQTGLDGIIVEKYYLTNATDAAADPANLQVNEVTYRIYADLKAGWKLQSIFANGILDGDQPMQFKTTTKFYNSPSGNKAFGNEIDYASLTGGLLMLDSYLTWGPAAASSGSNHYWGRLKSDDDGANQIVVPGGLIKNTTAFIGEPVSAKDGYLTSATAPAAAFGVQLGIDDLIAILNGTSAASQWDSDETDGAIITNLSNIAILGADPDNKILIGQFTTDGDFTFKINLKIKSPTGIIENLVSSPASAPEDFFVAALAQTLSPPALPTPPTVGVPTLTPPVIKIGGNVNISVTASDAVPGSVDSVVFYRNGTTRIGRSLSTVSPYTLTWTPAATGSFTITATAYDNEGTPGTSPSGVTLTVNANQAPVVTTLTLTPATVDYEEDITITVEASDNDGSVTQIALFKNSETTAFETLTGPGPHTFTEEAPNTGTILYIKAVATDNDLANSAPVSKSVNLNDPNGNPYKVQSQTVSCYLSDVFLVPVITRPIVKTDIIGFDMVMTFDSRYVRPTGLVKLSDEMGVPVANQRYITNIVDLPGYNEEIRIAISIENPGETGPDEFFSCDAVRSYKVAEVEFAKNLEFMPNQTVTFAVPDFRESRITGVETWLVDAGTYTTYADSVFVSKLKFWADNSPIYHHKREGTSLITNIFGRSDDFVTAVQPDSMGVFRYNFKLYDDTIQIRRDIANTTDPQKIVNGFDAYLTQRVVIEDRGFLPKAFQMIAMDVNIDGKVSAGDVTQIMQRSVKFYDEFRQSWNYDNQGNPTYSPEEPSIDWAWVDNKTLNEKLDHRISVNYPKTDATGFYRDRVPVNSIPHVRKAPLFALPIFWPVQGVACPEVRPEEYTGIMLGEVDGNYKNLEREENPLLKKGSMIEETAAETKVLFDLSNAAINEEYFVIPVSVSSSKGINSLDFAMKFDESKLTFKDVIKNTSGMESAVYYNPDDKTLRFSSYSLTGYSVDAPVVMVRFEVKNSSLVGSDMTFIRGLINGESSKVEATDLKLNTLIDRINIYPNPTKGLLNVELPEDANMVVMDLNSRIVRDLKNLGGNQKHQVDLSNLSRGTYLIKVYNKNFSVIKRVVVTK